MLYENVCIEGMGYVIPDNVVTSEWLERQIAPVYEALGVPFGYIERLTGIKEHRWWDEDLVPSDGAAMAGERAIADAGIKKKEVRCLVNTSVCRDYIEPATATFVHRKLGLPSEAMTFDVINACLGFINGIVLVANMIELGQIDTGLVVASEAPRMGQLATIQRLLKNPPDKQSLRDNLASFTLGAASVAMVLRHASKSKTGKRIIGGFAYGRSEHSDLCVAQNDWMRTKSTPMLHEGAKTVAVTWKNFRKELGWHNGSITKLFTHQVSEPQRVLGLTKTLRLPANGMDYPTLSYLGNTGAVAAPICMAIARDDKFLVDGDRVVLLGVGSGINSIILGIQW
ncbi:MAG: 3-oxoacyl-ACP synthase III [Anaerolineae bacterium]|nr:3-oxoacyl-ACP synthase III [Anaerolineae bacterium]